MGAILGRTTCSIPTQKFPAVLCNHHIRLGSHWKEKLHVEVEYYGPGPPGVSLLVWLVFSWE